MFKNQRYDGNDGAALEFQQGLQLTSVLWEGAGQTHYGKQRRQELLPSYEKVAPTAPAGQVEIMLCNRHPRAQDVSVTDLALGFAEERSEGTFAMS